VTLFLPVRYLCVQNRCGASVGEITRNTDFIDESTLAWTLRLTVGRAKPYELPPETPEAVRAQIASFDRNLRVADIDYFVVAFGQRADHLASGEWQTHSFCHRCGELASISANRALRDLRAGLAAQRTHEVRLSTVQRRRTPLL